MFEHPSYSCGWKHWFLVSGESSSKSKKFVLTSWCSPLLDRFWEISLGGKEGDNLTLGPRRIGLVLYQLGLQVQGGEEGGGTIPLHGGRARCSSCECRLWWLVWDRFLVMGWQVEEVLEAIFKESHQLSTKLKCTSCSLVIISAKLVDPCMLWKWLPVQVTWSEAIFTDSAKC